MVVGLGVFIEFHEGWFGAGDPGSGAPGVGADLAYTRGHILFGALLLPLLLAQALHVAPRVAGLVGMALLTAGVGVFAWTFLGSPVLLGIGVGVGVSGLFVGASR